MKVSVLAASTLFFILAQSTPVTIEPVIGPSDRHIIRHTHKVNCLNCFCGHQAIKRARHACPPDRDLIVCPPSIPDRTCYRCACYPRIPVSPSPPMMKPHSDDDHDDAEHVNDHHDDADDMMMETSDTDEDVDSMSSTPEPTMRPHPTGMKKKTHSTMMPKATHKPHPTMKSGPTKKPHATETAKHAKKTNTNMMSMPSKKPQPTMSATPTKKASPKMSSKPSKEPHPTNESRAQKPKPSPKACASFERGGGGGNTMFDVDLLNEHGTFKISWQMDTVPDKIEIFYEDEKIFTTKVPVSGHGSAYVKYSGKSSKIRVWVTSPTPGTGWFLMIGCPNDDH